MPGMNGFSAQLGQWAVTLCVSLSILWFASTLSPLSTKPHKDSLLQRHKAFLLNQGRRQGPRQLDCTYHLGAHQPWAGDRRPTLDAASLERHSTTWEKHRAKRPQQDLGWLPQLGIRHKEPPAFLTSVPFLLAMVRSFLATILSPDGGSGAKGHY